METLEFFLLFVAVFGSHLSVNNLLYLESLVIILKNLPSKCSVVNSGPSTKLILDNTAWCFLISGESIAVEQAFINTVNNLVKEWKLHAVWPPLVQEKRPQTFSKICQRRLLNSKQCKVEVSFYWHHQQLLGAEKTCQCNDQHSFI